MSKRENHAEREARRHEEKARRAIVDTYNTLTALDPEDAQGFLGGHIANIIGPIPDEFWRRMMLNAQLPCGRPGCSCETLRIEVYAALESLRDDWRAFVDEPNKIPKPK